MWELSNKIGTTRIWKQTYNTALVWEYESKMKTGLTLLFNKSCFALKVNQWIDYIMLTKLFVSWPSSFCEIIGNCFVTEGECIPGY